MKIATKISTGYGISIALMIGVLIYQGSVLHALLSLNVELTQINFEAARKTLELQEEVKYIHEFTRKFLIRWDPLFREQLKEFRALFARDLDTIRSLQLSKEETGQIERLSALWERYEAADFLDEWQEEPPDPVKEEIRAEQDEYLIDLGIEVGELFAAVQTAVAIRTEQASDRTRQAGRVAIFAAAAALTLSVIVWVVSVRSISRRVDQLTRGTKAVSKGDFSYRLDASGGDEFSQVTAAFNTMSIRLNELDELKKDFISHVSHELKNPLGSIHETIRLLLEEIPGPLQEKQKRLLQLNLQSAERLSSMIHNLLDLSRIDAGVMEYHFETQDLAALAREVVSQFEPQLRERRLELELHLPDEPVWVECDDSRLVQVVENLLGNARKFSPEDSIIRVEIFTGQKAAEIARENPFFSGAGGLAVFGVADRGPGVPDADKETIFDKFRQVQRPRRLTNQGAGLGLAICRSIVEAHQGAIWVEDRAGGGSVFYVLFKTREIASPREVIDKEVRVGQMG